MDLNKIDRKLRNLMLIKGALTFSYFHFESKPDANKNGIKEERHEIRRSGVVGFICLKDTAEEAQQLVSELNNALEVILKDEEDAFKEFLLKEINQDVNA